MDQPIAANWDGINKSDAPFILKASESPDCMDCDTYGGQIDILGPRGGRARRATANYRIMGVIPMKIAGTSGRVLTDYNGVWAFDPNSWAAPPVPPPVGMNYDLINITIAALTSVNVAVVTSGNQAVGPFDLSQYDLFAVAGASFSQSVSGGSAGGAFQIQGLINGVWQGLLQYGGGSSITSAGFFVASMLSGTLTAIRGQLFGLSSGGQSITIGVTGLQLYLIKKALPAWPSQSLTD